MGNLRVVILKGARVSLPNKNFKIDKIIGSKGC